MASNGNPYTNEESGFPGTTVDYGAPSSAYAAPSITEDAPYINHTGWAVELSREGLSTPDHMRLGTIRTEDMRPDGGEPPEQYYDIRDANKKARHSVETVDGDGWTITKGEKRRAPDPRWIPTPEPRPTLRMAPTSYFFTRPFDQLSKGNGARNLNSMHFSMAAHRRTYDVHGMAPQRTRRNTFRLEPAPWDTDIVDAPADMATDVPYARINVQDVPPSGSTRTWRL